MPNCQVRRSTIPSLQFTADLLQVDVSILRDEVHDLYDTLVDELGGKRPRGVKADRLFDYARECVVKQHLDGLCFTVHFDFDTVRYPVSSGRP